ncbi:MAG TPA: hypothetical protein VK689_10830 [Armatimonadota bacterium]|nr:hypothetical protein [Armatimonadota bacterium]
MPSADLKQVISRLESWRDEVIEHLRQVPGDPEAITREQELREAIECLLLCSRYGIRPDMQVCELPAVDYGAFSEYRLMWDYETDVRAAWQELEHEGEPVRAVPGDLLLSRVRR